jgi:predicted Zn-dependent protease
MKISTALPLILVLPIIGFVGYQAVTQFQESEAEKAAAAKASAPLLDDSAAAAQSAASAGQPPAQPDGPGAPVASSAASAAMAPSDPASAAGGDHDVADIRRRVMAGSKGTYIDEILAVSDSGLARWPDRLDNPLRVWVADGKGIPGWDPHYPDQVREAFDTWALTGLPMRFTYVRDSVDADVVVGWLEKFDTQITGRTLWSRDRNWWIVNGSIMLALHHTGGEALDEKAIHAIALHEVGHLLGLNHSSDTMNIMTARVRVRELSDADRATMKLLYSLPPGSLKN